MTNIHKQHSYQYKVCKKLRSMYLHEEDLCQQTKILQLRDKECDKLHSLGQQLIAHCYNTILSFPQ